MNILIVRNDKLGDFVLSLPSFALLKAAMPSSKFIALVPAYTQEIALYSEWIDDVVIDKSEDGSLKEILSLRREIIKYDFSAAITLYSTTRTGLILASSNINYRLAPATKIAQVFYNHTLTQRRSHSEKPEYDYNLDLITKYLIDNNIEAPSIPGPPYLSFDNSLVQNLRNKFIHTKNIKSSDKIIFIHAGSGGSANNLSLQQYALLATKLKSDRGIALVLTAGPGEFNIVNELSSLMQNLPHIVYHSTQGLVNFSQHIAFADLFISGSTGPLHIAGALNVPTAAFYTRRRSATPLRWQTLNTPERRLSFSPTPDAKEEDMTTIDIDAAARDISKHFLQHKVLPDPP